MRNNHKTYCVFLDVASHPQMYGIRGTNGICVGRISTDFQEVNRLAECCNSAGLSPVHLADVVEDVYRRVQSHPDPARWLRERRWCWSSWRLYRGCTRFTPV